MDAEEYLKLVNELQKEVERLQAEQEFQTLSVQDKIRHFAAKFGADASVSLNIACAESHFNPNARNPHSTAGGVYQWLDSSWANYSRKYYGYVEDKMNPDKNIELSNWVIANYGTRDWNASRWTGVGGGWEAQPFERGLCPTS